MKAFFISDRHDKEVLSRFKNVIKQFEAQGTKTDLSQLNRTPEQDQVDFEGAYKKNIASIKNSDILVAEVTNLSSGIGFLISTALNLKKPVLALYFGPSHKQLSTTLKGSASNKLMFFREYDTDTYKDVITKFLQKVKSITDTKFILIISPDIDKYLEWASDYKRMHKAQLVREAVEAYMENDKDWAEFQAEDDGMVKE